MEELITAAQQALTHEEIQRAAQILAKYGLGICVPHIHDQRSGAILPLPSGIVACEKNLTVSFEDRETADAGMSPVAWRWTPRGFEVCASCCTAGPDPG